MKSSKTSNTSNSGKSFRPASGEEKHAALMKLTDAKWIVVCMARALLESRTSKQAWADLEVATELEFEARGNLMQVCEVGVLE